MVKKIIDVGIVGNDATGDPIRDAFTKTNENFTELYAALGNSGGLTFTGLLQTPDTLVPNDILITNPTGTALLQKALVAGYGLSIDNTDPSRIVLTNSGATVVSDHSPALGGNLDSRANIIYNLPDPTNYDTLQSQLGLSNQDGFAISKSYGDRNYVALKGSPLVNIVNFIEGQYYAIAALGTTTNTQWNIIAGTTGVTYAVGSNFIARVVGAGYGTGTAYNAMSGYLSVPPGATVTQVPQRQEVVGRAGDTMTGPLVLSGDPAIDANPNTAATKNYVDSTAFASQADYFVSTYGDDYQPLIAENKKGRALAYSFKTIARALAAAEKSQAASGTELGPYSKEVVYTSNLQTYPSTVYAVTQVGSSIEYYLDITHSGGGTDPRKGSNPDIRSGLLFRGISSNAIAVIDYVGGISTAPNIERYNIHYIGPTRFILGENLEYGDPVKKSQITIHVESGEYYEHYPLRVSENVSLVGDEMRRVIIRPKAFISASKWANIYFRRDITFDSVSPIQLATAISVGSFTTGLTYTIASLGSTSNAQWNTIAGTVGITYIVGSSFLAADAGVGLGDGTAYCVYGYNYLTDPSRSLYNRTISNSGSFNNAQKILYANKAFITAEALGYLDNNFNAVITASDSSTNSFTCLSNTNLNIGMPIRFSPFTTYVTATSAANNHITVGSTDGLILGQPIQFSGVSLGGLVLNNTYYVLSIVDSTNITISNVYPGVIHPVLTDAGFATLTSFNATFGGISSSVTYYVLGLIGNTQFTISSTISGTTPGSIVNLTTSLVGNSTMQGKFYRADSDYATTVGNLVDAIGFDLLYGDYTKTLEFGIEFYSSPVGLVDVGYRLTQTSDLVAYIGALVNYVIAQTPVPLSYQHTASSVTQLRNFINIAESGFGTAVNGLIQLASDIVNQDVSFNFPKYNNKMDMFLLNNAAITRFFTAQGHGGFVGVLDPEGQILTKSPFIEIAASFSQSTNSQAFAGGIFVDGFSGNLSCVITQNIDTQTYSVSSSAFKIRQPQTPCSFYVKGIRFEVDYISEFDPVSGTLNLHLNSATVDNVLYTNFNTDSLLTNGLYIELIGAGNRSIVTTHFTNINDLGYGIVATNNGLIEAVSLFTYYCYRAIYAVNGAQIRSLNGSNSYGVYGITAEASDPTEIPSVTNLYYPMAQTATIYKKLGYSTSGVSGDLLVYITNYQYLPFNISELEIDHNGIVTLYQITTVKQVTDVPNVAQLTLGSNSNSIVSINISNTGLAVSVTDGQPVIVRSLQNFRFNNVLNTNPIRPSTALLFDNDFDIYRVLSYSTVGLPIQQAVLTTSTSYNYIKVLVDSNAGMTAGSGRAGDTTFYCSSNLTANEKSRLVGKLFGWGSSMHTIIGFEDTTVTGQSYCRVTIDTPLTKSLLSGQGNIPITSYSRNSSGVVTITATAHGLTSLNNVVISGTNEIDTVGLFVNITYLTPDTFSYQTSTLTPVTGTGGYISGLSQIDLRSGMDNKQNIKIANVSRNGNVAYVTTTYPHYLNTGNTVNIKGVTITSNSNPGFNATNAVITSIDDYNFSYSNSGANLASNTAITGIIYSTTAFSINSISRSNSLSISTVTTSSNHGLSIGDTVNIVNTDFVLTVSSTSSVTNAITITNSASEGGNTYTTSNTTTGLIVGMPIVFSGSGLLGTNIAVGTTYYIKTIASSNSITISATPPSGAFTTFLLATISGASGNAAAGWGFGTLNVDILTVPSTNKFTYKNAGTELSTTAFTGPSIANAYFIDPTLARVTIYISLTRCTGHDFLSIGTGGFADTNYPNNIYGASVNRNQTVNEVTEIGNGRCFYVSTDQDGNFKVGPFFSVDQGTGIVKFASSIVLTNLDGLGFKRGVAISSFNADDTMADDAIDAVPTQSAVVGYINRRLGINAVGSILTFDKIGPGFLPLDGSVPFSGTLDMSSHKIINVTSPTSDSDAANRGFVNSSIANLLSKSGGTMSGNINMGGNNLTSVGGIDMSSNKITSLASPTISSDAANKLYVDAQVAAYDQLSELRDVSITTTNSYTASSVSAPSGSGPYSVIFTIPTQTTAPTSGIGYTVSGNSNSNYNGTFSATATSTTSITLSYLTNPGSYGTGTTTLTTSGISSGDQLAYNGTSWINASPSGGISSTVTSIVVSQIARTSNVVTVVTNSAHGLNNNDKMTINNLVINNNSIPGFKGSYSITKVDAVTFTYVNFGAEIVNLTALTGTATATSSSGNYVLISSTNNMSVGTPITFSGSTIGNLSTNNTYWVASITSQTTLPVAEVSKSGYVVTVSTGGSPFTLNSFTSKLLQGDGTYRVTFAISQNPAPANGVSYLVLGNSNNSIFTAYSTSTVSMTLIYPADPGVYGTGTTTIQYLATHGLTTGQVVTISGTGLVDQANVSITVTNGTQFTYTQSTSGTIAGTIVNGTATPQPQITLSNTLGGSVVTQTGAIGSMTFTAAVVGAVQIFSNTINSGVVVNSMVAAGAAIDQTKLNLNRATVGLNTPLSPVTFGVAAFSSSYFTSTNGFISLAANSVSLSNVASIATNNVLGNISGITSNVNTVPVDSSSSANTLVLRDSSSNFSAGTITAALSGNASTATKLASSVNINGVAFDGSGNITVTAAAGTLTGATLASNVLAASLTSVGTLTGLTVSGAIVPNGTGTINLGSTLAYWNNAYINTLTIGTTIVPNANNTLNIGSSSYYWNTIYGNATSANYADLAENYEGDREYDYGTVVMIGGEKEVTLATGFGTTKVAGVVSENPAHLMNASCPGIKVPVALQGRVPCKVVGKISKGDLMVVGLVPGVAMASDDPKAGSIIGKALADYDSDRIGIIEVLVGKH